MPNNVKSFCFLHRILRQCCLSPSTQGSFCTLWYMHVLQLCYCACLLPLSPILSITGKNSISSTCVKWSELCRGTSIFLTHAEKINLRGLNYCWIVISAMWFTPEKSKKGYVNLSQTAPKLCLSWDVCINGLQVVPKISNLTIHYKTTCTIKFCLANSSQRAALWTTTLVVLASRSKFGSKTW